ncbi:unnamed protein product [Phytophthora fragariaefolia]|uniref:Unnamed protein product n=1 Tax=Phytophthora fragariaefolia TaxID=1490495 RepID=A0A9W7CJ36_9STRA|nr:unnamed protein product [Phytophthora fragariaefolia]
MATGKKEGMREGGPGRERGALVRQSRHSQGLPPEEQKDLDDVVREAQKASAANRKAAKEEKERSSAEDRPTSEPAALDAHQVFEGDDSGSRPTQPEIVEGESVQNEPTQVSEGGANVEVSLEEDPVSDSQLPGQDVGLLDDALELAEEKPLSTVQEDAVLEDLNVSSHLESKAEVSTETAQGVESKLTWSPPDLDTYVAREVSRWEQVRSERVYPPSVEYVWPELHPNSLPWLSAMLEVSKFLDDRVTLNDPVQSWITELNLSWRDSALARDLTAVQIPVELCTARECVAILQTLLVEAGFQFDNLIPEWFRTAASRVMADSVREPVRHMLRLLAVEQIEWRQLVVGAKFKVVPSLDVQEVSGCPPILEYHAEDTEGDLLMTDHEFDLLGRNYVLRLRMTGLRPIRSSEGSSTGEPNSKRRQYHPPREDLLTSLPSVLPSSSSSRMESIQDARTSSSQDADTLPSQVGTTDRSSPVATTSGSYASRKSSPGSSSAALGLLEVSLEVARWVSTSRERPFRNEGLIPRSTKTTSKWRGLCRRLVLRCPELALPRRAGNIVIPAEVRRRATRTLEVRDCILTDVLAVVGIRPSDPRSGDPRHDDQVDQNGRAFHSGLDVHRARPRRTSSPNDGSTKLNDGPRKLNDDSAKRAPRKFLSQEIPDVATLIQAAGAEAARVERERVKALALHHIQQQQRAEDDERHEAERAACAQQGQAGLEVQQRSLLEKLKAVETVRVQEQEAARNMQKFQAEQIRNLKASSAEMQPGRTTTAPNSATPVKTEANNPERATRFPVVSGVNMGQASGIWTKMGQMNLSETAIAQLRATIPNINRSAYAGSVKAEGPDPKKSERKPKPSRRRPNRDLSPDSSDPSSDSDEDDSDFSSSSDSSGEKARSSTKTSSKAKVGATLLTVRPYVNPNSLEKFTRRHR